MTEHESNLFDHVNYRSHDGVAWITLNRPRALNSFTSQMYGEVKNAIRLAEADESVDVFVITGTGRAFGTGGDLKELLAAIDGPNPLDVYRFEDNTPFETLRSSTKSSIAAVNGLCFGGGLCVALLCDLQVAATSAMFGVPEGRVGYAESFTPKVLAGRISIGQQKYLTLTGSSISSSEAVRIGLINECVEDDRLMERTSELIAELRQTTPSARKHYKEFIARTMPSGDFSDHRAAISDPACIAGLREFANRSHSDK